ncbi:hypothetical protein [Aquicoccus sp. SU-CL01552]|uniref:hypothetical protein n=1 Tax=Aquicoccus sp. SU-CL01552 TaxID=3127656 RepID=UPI0031088A30
MAKLKKPKKIVLKPKQAHDVITWLYGKTSVAPKEFTTEDCGFAQAMLVEMLNASFAMGFVEALFRAAAKLPSGPKKVITTFLKGAGKTLVKYKDKDDLAEMIKKPVIYKAAQAQMARASRSVWRIREQTGELIY